MAGRPTVDAVNLDLSGPGGALKVISNGGTFDIIGSSLRALTSLNRFRGLQADLQRRFQPTTEFRIFLKTRHLARVTRSGKLRPTPMDFILGKSKPHRH